MFDVVTYQFGNELLHSRLEFVGVGWPELQPIEQKSLAYIIAEAYQDDTVLTTSYTLFILCVHHV